jgi:hypothetical protein
MGAVNGGVTRRMGPVGTLGDARRGGGAGVPWLGRSAGAVCGVVAGVGKGGVDRGATGRGGVASGGIASGGVWVAGARDTGGTDGDVTGVPDVAGAVVRVSAVAHAPERGATGAVGGGTAGAGDAARCGTGAAAGVDGGSPQVGVVMTGWVATDGADPMKSSSMTPLAPMPITPPQTEQRARTPA